MLLLLPDVAYFVCKRLDQRHFRRIFGFFAFLGPDTDILQLMCKVLGRPLVERAELWKWAEGFGWRHVSGRLRGPRIHLRFLHANFVNHFKVLALVSLRRFGPHRWQVCRKLVN